MVEDDSAEIERALHAHLAGEFPQPKRVPVPVAAALRTVEHVLAVRPGRPTRGHKLDVARIQEKGRRGHRFAGCEFIRAPRHLASCVDRGPSVAWSYSDALLTWLTVGRLVNILTSSVGPADSAVLPADLKDRV